jgi:hypothetical protein
MKSTKPLTIMGDLARHMEEADRLKGELERSLTIQAIWPEAFAGDLRCSFSGVQKEGAVKGKPGRYFCFTDSWFKREDGHTYHLTRAELARFKPESFIHKEYLGG